MKLLWKCSFLPLGVDAVVYDNDKNKSVKNVFTLGV